MWLWPKCSSCKWDPSLPWYSLIYKPIPVPFRHNINTFLKISTNNPHISPASISSFPTVILAKQTRKLRKHFEWGCHIWKNWNCYTFFSYSFLRTKQNTLADFRHIARFLQTNCILQLLFGFERLWKTLKERLANSLDVWHPN